MASSKLMEAAADILAGSKSKATAMPPQKLEGEVVDVGGPTPQNYKNDDNSAKLDTTKAAKSATAPTTKSSDASGKVVDSLRKENVDEDDNEIIDEDEDVSFNEDIEALFAGETLSEEFKTKATTIFEARVLDRVSQIQEQMEAEYATMFEESVNAIKDELAEKVDDYLNYVVEQWLEQNEIAVETGLRAEITEDFIAGLRNLFAEHYIDVPSEKVDLVEELAAQVQELEDKLNEQIEHGIELSKALVESRKEEITRAVCEGLTETQVQKIKALAESVEFSTEEEYESKLETIRENYFPTGVKKAVATQLTEQVEDTATNNEASGFTDPFVQAVSQAISKTKL